MYFSIYVTNKTATGNEKRKTATAFHVCTIQISKLYWAERRKSEAVKAKNGHRHDVINELSWRLKEEKKLNSEFGF